jgi:hypothetical protein
VVLIKTSGHSHQPSRKQGEGERAQRIDFKHYSGFDSTEVPVAQASRLRVVAASRRHSLRGTPLSRLVPRAPRLLTQMILHIPHPDHVRP